MIYCYFYSGHKRGEPEQGVAFSGYYEGSEPIDSAEKLEALRLAVAGDIPGAIVSHLSLLATKQG